MKLRCQICFEFIATVDKVKLAYPMYGFMFTSVDPHHGMPDPFPPSAEWEHFKCPYGTHRPMISDNEIQTDEGLITVKQLIKREDISTERTVKTRESVKKNTEDVPVRGVREGIQDGKGKGRMPEAFACETCGKEFSKEINLKRHKVMAHKGV
jgi:hypothetical protein